MTTRARSRVGALALAGLFALVPVAGSVALAPTAAADDQVVACLAEEQAFDPDVACIEYRDDEGNLVEPVVVDADEPDRSEFTRENIEPISAEVDAEPISAEVDIEPISAELDAERTAAEEEIDYVGSLLVLAAMSLLSLGSIAFAAYVLFFKKPPVRKNAV